MTDGDSTTGNNVAVGRIAAVGDGTVVGDALQADSRNKLAMQLKEILVIWRIIFYSRGIAVHLVFF